MRQIDDRLHRPFEQGHAHFVEHEGKKERNDQMSDDLHDGDKDGVQKNGLRFVQCKHIDKMLQPDPFRAKVPHRMIVLKSNHNAEHRDDTEQDEPDQSRHEHDEVMFLKTFCSHLFSPFCQHPGVPIWLRPLNWSFKRGTPVMYPSSLFTSGNDHSRFVASGSFPNRFLDFLRNLAHRPDPANLQRRCQNRQAERRPLRCGETSRPPSSSGLPSVFPSCLSGNIAGCTHPPSVYRESALFSTNVE